MTDAEIDALAREILTYAIHTVLDWDSDFFHEVLRLPDGELIPIYGATSDEKIGSVLCELVPLPIVKQVIVESERILDEFVESLKSQPLSDHNLRMIRKTYAKSRGRTIKLMARSATLHLIAFFHTRLGDLLGEAIEDCEGVAEAYLTGSFAMALDSYAPEPVKVDARKGIEKAAERVANRKREFLRDSIQDLPFVITKTRRGAVPKSLTVREREREEFTAKIESAYRTRRELTGKKPTKKSVAEQLRMGGVNPRTGTDSRLNTFNTKLKRLGVNYDAIAARIEVESTQ
jgi:hypothetical protein